MINKEEEQKLDNQTASIASGILDQEMNNSSARSNLAVNQAPGGKILLDNADIQIQNFNASAVAAQGALNDSPKNITDSYSRAMGDNLVGSARPEFNNSGQPKMLAGASVLNDFNPGE